MTALAEEARLILIVIAPARDGQSECGSRLRPKLSKMEKADRNIYALVCYRLYGDGQHSLGLAVTTQSHVFLFSVHRGFQAVCAVRFHVLFLNFLYSCCTPQAESSVGHLYLL